ncbi:Protein TraC (plasmid) [Caballeronia sp. SBC1]|uniref:TraC family protein n=1 Tax=Caballeronia sp. SBC1 TaxID=2705548 RepID=UPI001409C97F|nr:TraC family protein [Caballeronia sp. SBC1]QIN68024.1 Protein TraC [Caballeronia sp. SBC1]
MGATDRIAEMLDRNRPGDAFTCLAADDNMFFFEDGALGALLQGDFITGADINIQKMLENVLGEHYPPGTFIQDIQMAVPDLDDQLSPYREARVHSPYGNRVAKVACDDRANFIAAAAHQRLAPTLTTRVLDARHYVAIKIPTRGIPFPKASEIAEFRELRDRVQAMYEAAKLPVEPIGPDEYLAVLRRYFDMYGKWNRSYDEDKSIRDQIFTPSQRIKQLKSTIRADSPTSAGHVHIGLMTTAKYPKKASLYLMDLLRGTPDGTGTQISMPFVLTTTVHVPEQSKKIGGVRTKSVLITQQAFGPLLKWVPLLAAKKKGFDTLISALDSGANAVEVNTTLALFNRSARDINRMAARLKSYFSGKDMQMSLEKHITWPNFYNTLPLCPSARSIERTRRFFTMGSVHAAQFLPVIDEWRGYGNAMLLTTRRGRPFGYDLFHGRNSNFNWLLTADAGAGKSFAVQRMLQDYLALGAIVRILDIRRSHGKFTKAHHGDYIEFTDKTRDSLNPFTNVTDIDESIGVLQALLCKMANPNEPTRSSEAVRIMSSIKSVWASYGPAMEVTQVYQYLMNQANDEISRELARKLYPFTTEGPYGAWFSGPNTLHADAQLVTFELFELRSQPHLQQVIQQLLMIRCEQDMYATKGSAQQKILVIEEGGDIMPDEPFARFIAQLYAKVRKETGSIGLILQNLTQLYNSPHGPTIAGTAATKFIMQQASESINLARKNGWMDIGEAEADLLRSVHTIKGRGGYSEIYFRTESGSGIARLVESRFNQVLFSSEGAEKHVILAAADRGDDVIEAVHEFIRGENA